MKMPISIDGIPSIEGAIPLILQDEKLATLVGVGGWEPLGLGYDNWQSDAAHEVILERALDKKVFRSLHYENSVCMELPLPEPEPEPEETPIYED